MRWRRKRKRQPFSREDTQRYEEAATDRLRGLSRLEFSNRDPESVEARLRNMIYGTSRD